MMTNIMTVTMETKKMHPATKQYWKNKDRLGIKRVNIDLEEQLWKKVGEEAEVQGVKKREIVEKALREYLDNRF